MMHNIKHGGVHSGAGRPTGSRNKSTISREAISRETIVKLTAARISNYGPLAPSDIAALNPIEVMGYAMILEASAGRWLVAAEIASKLAPCRFATMQHVTTETTIRRSLDDMTDEELVALAANVDEGDEADST